jgi:y4mF family transcriptional regulator
MDTTESLGDFVAKRRKALGMTQGDLARLSGVSLQLVRDLEQGHRMGFNTNKVNQLLRLLGYQLGPVPLVRSDLLRLA